MMQLLKQLAALAICTIVLGGCSETTQRETREALDAAAEDTKANAEKMGNVFEATGDQIKEEFSDSPETAPEATPETPVATEPRP